MTRKAIFRLANRIAQDLQHAGGVQTYNKLMIGNSSLLMFCRDASGHQGVLRIGLFPENAVATRLRTEHAREGWTGAERIIDLAARHDDPTRPHGVSAGLMAVLNHVGCDTVTRDGVAASASRADRHDRGVRTRAGRKRALELAVATDLAGDARAGPHLPSLLARIPAASATLGLPAAASRRIRGNILAIVVNRPPGDVTSLDTTSLRALRRAHTEAFAPRMAAVIATRPDCQADDLRLATWAAFDGWPMEWRLRQHLLLWDWARDAPESDLLADDVFAAVTVDDAAAETRAETLLRRLQIITRSDVARAAIRSATPAAWAVATEVQRRLAGAFWYRPPILSADCLDPFQSEADILAAARHPVAS